MAINVERQFQKSERCNTQLNIRNGRPGPVAAEFDDSFELIESNRTKEQLRSITFMRNSSGTIQGGKGDATAVYRALGYDPGVDN